MKRHGKEEKSKTHIQSRDETNGEPAQAPDAFESFEEFAPIIALAKASESFEPQPGFTRRVMSKIAPTAEKHAPSRGHYRRRRTTGILFKNLTQAASGSDIALCFFLAGFFYLILGIVFYVGLKSFELRLSEAGWIMLQPRIAFVTAGLLGALGLILMIKGLSGVRIAHMGIIGYILFSVFNGIRLHMAPTSPFNLAGILCFVGGSVLLGLFLGATVQKYRQQTM
jgi:hypothetical protein